ncbi:MAG: FprA family A-type flavoprotein [Lachnospiraceae bacterium]
MKPVEIRKDIYWVGAIDWSLKNFHGYSTQRGSTYNAYLIMDEKITLIDGVKAPFTEEQKARIEAIVPLEKIDYIISNHVEMDHSGSIPAISKACPNAKIVTSLPNGLKGLKAHYGDLPYEGVKAGESLSIGKRTLSFVPTPMLHWPDNMVTYCPEEKILFSNDAFGQHYATSKRFDDDTNLTEALEEAKKYYANIIMLYGKQASGALEIVKGLDLEMIAPSHGIIWRSNIQDILDAYGVWTSNEPEEAAVVIYDTMWHSTEQMAKTIVDALTEKGIPTQLFNLAVSHNSDITTEILTSKYVIVGSPTLNNNMLPTVASFLCYLKGLTPKNRKAFAFGSYGWGGQSAGQIEEELKACGFDICMDKVRLTYIPQKEQLEKLREDVLAAFS